MISSESSAQLAVLADMPGTSVDVVNVMPGSWVSPTTAPTTVGGEIGIGAGLSNDTAVNMVTSGSKCCAAMPAVAGDALGVENTGGGSSSLRRAACLPMGVLIVALPFLPIVVHQRIKLTEYGEGKSMLSHEHTSQEGKNLRIWLPPKRDLRNLTLGDRTFERIWW